MSFLFPLPLSSMSRSRQWMMFHPPSYRLVLPTRPCHCNQWLPFLAKQLEHLSQESNGTRMVHPSSVRVLASRCWTREHCILMVSMWEHLLAGRKAACHYPFGSEQQVCLICSVTVNKPNITLTHHQECVDFGTFLYSPVEGIHPCGWSALSTRIKTKVVRK